MTRQTIAANDARLRWPGAVSLQQEADWVKPWRIPYGEKGLFHDDLLLRAMMPAGVRLVFRTNSSRIAGNVLPTVESSPIDLYCDGNLIGLQPLSNAERFSFDGLPSGTKTAELWLPQFGEFRLRSLELDHGATVEIFEDRRPRWVTYGSSISQCKLAASPSQTWPAIVARTRGLNLTCLGYGGQCHLDTMIARLIRDLPADYISLCVGINILGYGSLGPRAFRPGIIGFVKIIRDKHPTTPILVCSPIVSPPQETACNAVGLNLVTMRIEVEAAVRTLQGAGDHHVQYQDGLQLFNADLSAFMPDQLHPNAEGYHRFAQNFLTHAAPKLFS